MTKKQKTLVLLDGNALIHRSYHALPPLTTKQGEVVHAVYGFTMTLLSVLEKFKPDYIAASFDLAGPTFRDELYEDYKATRVAAPDDLYAQIPRVKEIVRAFNIPIYEKEGYEADDCVGTIARQAAKEGVEVIIVTGDNDVLQLVDDQIKVFSIRKGLKDLVLYDREAVKKKYGFDPELIPDYKGLAGDASDNIPGVAGIGAKSATLLLQEFGSLENIYQHLPHIKESLRKKLEAGKASATLSKKLGTINTSVPLTLKLSDCVTHDFDRDQLTALLSELEFYSLVKRLPGANSKLVTRNSQSGATKIQVREKNSKRLTKKQEVDALFKNFSGLVAVVVREKTESLFGGGIESVQLASDTQQEWVIEWNNETQQVLKTWLEDSAKPKIVFDTKHLMHLFDREGLRLSGVTRDLSLIAYLLSSGGRATLSELVFKELGEETTEPNASQLQKLSTLLWRRLEREAKTQTPGKTLVEVYEKIELPLVPILFAMEKRGIRLNTETFAAMSRELAKELEKLEKKIHTLAGKTFNINSSRQLADILFVDLKMPTDNIKKGKTGYSTASSELEKLRADYPIVSLIEEYRELFKLKTTYLDPIPTMVDASSRVHTTYHQTVATTGRLSSTDPNLQNIPARQAWSERVRSAFEAEPGLRLVGADYSQIELRVAAHLSGDKRLKEAFERGEDIHRKTAALVFGIAPEAVTDDMRRQAKVFNFGILYGMGSFGLAQAAGIDQKEAANFIKTYFKEFAGVAEYLERSKAFAREHGFVETELGRRRAVPEIQSNNLQVARSGERMAVNMPVQGLAADIMKLAMIACDRLIREHYTGSVEMLLQVHDELIFEAKETAVEQFAKDVKKEMENVYRLTVPLVVSVAIGKNWGEI